MHTTYHKLSARERDAAPRFYYRRARTDRTFCQRLRRAFRSLLAFLFTQVGVCALVAAYMVLGAFVFAALEAESQMKEAVAARDVKERGIGCKKGGGES